MKRLVKPLSAALVFSCVVVSLVVPSLAETEVNFTGQVRVRTEGDKRSFQAGAPTKETTFLRTRLALEAIYEEYTHVFIQLQDSRTWGGTTQSGQGASGTLADGENVDLHQAFIKMDRLFGPNWGLQAGRYELNLGNQRVFGAVGWHNVGRSWEGANLWYEVPAVSVTGYWLKRWERNDSVRNSDFNIFGANAKIKDYGAELFFFWENDANKNLVPDFDSNTNALDRLDLGGYYRKVFGVTDVEVNAVYQFGNRALVQTTARDTSVTGQDISAYLITAEVGVTVSEEKKARIAALIDFASGDDDPTGGTFKTYDNLYYTGHKFRGRMDYFLASNEQGLMDLMLRGSVAPASGWELRADIHYFMTAEKYVDFDAQETSAVGWEVDLAARTTRIAGMKVDGGLAFFVPDDSFAGFADTKTGLWGYVMLTGNFGGKM